MSDNKHNGRGFGGKGYYIALILCAAAIGITSYVYQRNSIQKEASLQDTAPEEVVLGTMSTEENVAVLATEPRGEATVPTTGPTAKPEKKPLKTASPVSGQELWGYSMEALSYNQTTRDWRVHNGVDIAAEEGTPVCAAADGEVYTVYEDDTLGCTVVIRHDGGYTTSYSCLSKDLPVQAGDTVTLGQTIGYAGTTALVENTMGSHVHFSVSHQEQPMDPAEFLALGE
jgi:murein DD-endopeptidase MepM/ murein hydrolase activator NlpD